LNTGAGASSASIFTTNAVDGGRWELDYYDAVEGEEPWQR
jgi:hypothetical protein